MEGIEEGITEVADTWMPNGDLHDGANYQNGLLMLPL